MMIDPSMLYNNSTQRINAAHVPDMPFHQRIYDRMGAVNIARSQEIALMQMSMMPGGIDSFKRNIENIH